MRIAASHFCDSQLLTGTIDLPSLRGLSLRETLFALKKELKSATPLVF
jgi:hypothetical protein